MKKVLFFCSAVMIICYCQLNFAISNSMTHESIAIAMVSNNEEVTSTATISFSEKELTDQTNGTISKGRLPTTGESVGIGLSFLGLMLIIIIFRKKLKRND